MDYSFPSIGKLIAMDYMYYEFSTQDANAVADRAMVQFQLVNMTGG
jgi:hypothetical protein